MAGNDLGSLLGGLLGGGGQSGGSGGGNILGSLLGGLLGGGAGGAGTSGMGTSAGSNPLGGLLEMITKSGLVDKGQLDSWVGTGDNQALSPEQVKQAVPDETLDRVAGEAGVSRDEAAAQVARELPQVVDKLTPEGQVPSSGSLEDLIKQQKL
ncbi:YidB family protein [Streptomyces sp. NBC_00006]|uniref:YidB family protein n=1 Tax=unclassified Streptomyces TaxID=2593676 RepID=UPI0022572F31|nr:MULTISPECIES: YidB family protein [unclassified Streptomyces]MCX4833471.1 YidB family protein [Streptomyces sp. NBC_01016]MCX5534452.1 YidB family protein [Streptomyces sp. NBC_00006]